MTSKEKAKELYDKYCNMESWCDDAKECALIAVDEILQLVDETMKGWLDHDIIAYWQEVKSEINKL